MLGAVVGAGINLGAQALGNIANGCDAFQNIDWGSVAVSGLAGGVAGLGGAWFADAAETATAAESAPSIAEANAEHIFRDEAGHFAEDTSANRQLIRSVVKPGNYIRTGGGGEDLFRETLPNGTQVWAKVSNGSITNGGLNQVPLS